VIAAAITHREGWLARTLSLPPLRALGLVSYGAYLYHWPIYVILTPARTGDSGWSLTAVRVGATLLIAVASYRLVEQPIRRGLRARRVLAIGASAIATLAAVSLVAATAGAHPILDEASGALDNTVTVTHAAARLPLREHRLMLAGSSIAAMLAGPFRETAGARRLVLLNRAVIGCAFPDGITRIERPGESPTPYPFHTCGGTWRRDVAMFRPDAVLYIPGAEPGPTRFEFLHEHRFVGACSPSYERVYRADLLRHIALFARPATTVYLTTFAYSSLPFLSIEWYHGTDCVNAAIRSVARSTPNVALVDVNAYMCARPDRPCRFTYRGVPIRPDGVHYSGPGALPVAAWVLHQMHLP
jgi:hypothetical protein